MSLYLPDTNVLIAFGRDAAVEKKLNAAITGGSTFVLAPSTIEELSRGVVNGGSRHFENDRRVFIWMRMHRWKVLELPVPFMGTILGSPVRRSRVVPEHYLQLIEMIARSANFDEFVRRKDAPDSVFGDFQLLFYLADPQIYLLTKEEFSNDIKNSPQRTRIVQLDSLIQKVR